MVSEFVYPRCITLCCCQSLIDSGRLNNNYTNRMRVSWERDSTNYTIHMRKSIDRLKSESDISAPFKSRDYYDVTREMTQYSSVMLNKCNHSMWRTARMPCLASNSARCTSNGTNLGFLRSLIIQAKSDTHLKRSN